MIEAFNSHIKIHNYELGDNKTLERYLTIMDVMPNGYRLPKMKLYYYDEDESCLIVPRGYNIPRLQSILEDNKVKYSKSSDPSTRINIKLLGKPRDDLQQSAIDFLLSEGEFNNLLYETQKFLCMNTGTGKTFSSIAAVCKLKRRVIIIVDSLNIAEQWRDAFLNFTDIKDKDIYLISGTKSITKLFKDKEFDPSYKVYIALHQTLGNLFKENPKKVTKFFLRIKVGIKIIDEAHAWWENTFKIDAVTNTAINFYLTATPGCSNPDENRLFQYCYEKVPFFGRENTLSWRYNSTTVEEDERYIKAYYVTFNSHPNYNTQLDMTRRDQFDMNKYADYVKDESFEINFDILTKLINICLKKKDNRRIVIILGKNELIQKFYQFLTEAYPDKSIGRFCGLVSAKNKEDEKFKDIVLSTEKSLGKAINVENIGYLINTLPFSSSVIAQQLIGRLRKNAKYSYLFDIADIGFQNCKNNQKYRRNTYDKITISNRDIEFE